MCELALTKAQSEKRVLTPLIVVALLTGCLALF